MKKRILAGVLASAAALAAVSFTGCNDNTAPHVSDDDDTLSILAWSGNGDMPSLIEFFCEKTGTPEDKVKWVQLGAAGGDARKEYKGYLDGNEDADIILCDAEWALEYANNAKYTVPLSTIGIEKSQFTDAYTYTLEIGTNKNGEFVGATWQATPGGFVYRADYAEQYLGVTSPDEMQALVKDWDTFEQTADRLAKEHGKALCSSEGGLWQVKQCERTSSWIGSDGKLAIDDSVNQFVEMVKKYADNGYISSAEQWSDQWAPSVTSGDAIGDFAPTWGLLNNGSGTIAENFAGGKDAEGVLGLCEGPGAYYWGGTFMEVCNGCNSSSLAKKWIETFAINADSMKEYCQKTGDFMNNTKVMEEMSKDTTLTNKLFKNGTHQFGVLYKQADKIRVYVTEYDGAIKEKFNNAVQDYAIKGVTDSVDAAIAAFRSSVAADYADLV